MLASRISLLAARPAAAAQHRARSGAGRQRVTDVRTVVGEGEVFLDVRTADGGGALADLALRKADLFESEFGLKLRCAVND